MSDLTDDELAMACGFVGSSHDTTVEFDDAFWRLVEEIRRHRAAQTAGAEQVRSVVRDAFGTVSGMSGEAFAQRHIEDIATRVASQLAAPAAIDSERVRSVVRDACIDLVGRFVPSGSSDAIADRVSSQLAVAESVTELRLCEATRLVLRPGQLYRFTVDQRCSLCSDAASQLAAPAALDSERVRSVVHAAVRELAGIGQWPPPNELCAAIADRVALQLATHVNSVTVIGRDNTTVVLTIQMPSCQLSKEHVEVVALAAADGVRSRLGARS